MLLEDEMERPDVDQLFSNVEEQFKTGLEITDCLFSLQNAH
jgi:hypothetical protein